MAPNTLCDTANSDDAKGNLTLVEKILQTGFRIDWHSEWRHSPLFVAVAKVLGPGVFLLLRYSADANEVAWTHYDRNPQRPRTGMSLLKYTVKKGHADVAEALRQSGAGNLTYIRLGKLTRSEA